ncbi:DUF6090 family protein [Pseudotenacibaculum sp. MALMAid0570]|uniref:DUF6090 family protein n=1 Tax=Pseudotenacibaculum sp. MALMAid0570 TaxID=3143938 RepID=UPI0032DF16F7
MIKFFRTIRKSLISEGNTSKYLKYAIGEIALVVVGILLALQVSNWNTNLKKEEQELKFLEHIYEDLSGMLSDINSDYHSLKLGDRSHFRILNYIENDLSYKDTMSFDFYWLAKDEYVYPVRSTYDAIKEEGFAIIKNDSIRKGIQIAYENFFPRISKKNPFYPDLEVFFSEYLQNNFTINSDSTLISTEKFPSYNLKYPYKRQSEGKTHYITIGFVPKNFEQLKKDEKFKVLMRQAYLYRTYKISRYAGGKFYVSSLLKLIEKELKNRQ